MNINQSYLYCQRLATQHYENFPVGSFLIPRRLRPHVHAVYAFARTADDFADELGAKDPEAALEKLQQWDEFLEESLAGRASDPVFIALGETIRQFNLPAQLFHDLIHAFRRDVTVKRYETMERLLQDYCRYSANPVGRLVLLLHGYLDEEMMRLSDSICTALQLANFWQDAAIDLDKDRIYLPQEDLLKFGLSGKDLFRREATPEFKRLLRHEIDFTRILFDKGAALIPRLRGRLGLEIKATWLGGMGILDKIERVDYDVFRQRPQWSKWERVGLLLKTLLLLHSPPPRRGRDRPALSGLVLSLSTLLRVNSVEGVEGVGVTKRHSEITLPLSPSHKGRGKKNTPPRRFSETLSPVLSSNFYLAMRLLPKEQRQAMFTFYQFCRAVDDTVDLSQSRTKSEETLGHWKNQLLLCYQGTPTGAITQQLREVIYRYKIPFEELEAVLKGVEMDLYQHRFQTFQELERYCYHVASAVGLVSARIFGVTHPQGAEFAVVLGKALQLTNILRDLKEDQQKGRVYLPQDELERFDYSLEKLQNAVRDDSFLSLMDYQCRRARLFFEKTDSVFDSLPLADQKKFLPARIMEEIYKALLGQIERKPYHVFRKRITVSLWKKIGIALKCRISRYAL